VRKLLASDYARGMEALRNREHGEHALVIGNSPWRKHFPVSAWFGPTIACNAYYRDADRFPSYIVAFDSNMIRELVEAHAYRDAACVFRANECRPKVLESVPAEERGQWFHLDDPSFDPERRGAFGSQAGTLAVVLAGWLGCASLTLVGFSLSLANIYAGSKEYGNATPTEDNPGSRGQDFSRMRKALEEFSRLSPGASIHWIAPGEWMLAKLDQGAVAVR